MPRLYVGNRAVQKRGTGPMNINGRKYRYNRRPAQRLAIWLLVAMFGFLFPAEAIAATQPAAVATADPVTYTFEETIWITNKGTTTAQRVRLEVPLMAALSSTGQEVVEARYNIEPQEIQTLPNGNRVGVFLIDSIRPGERVPVRQTYTVRLYDSATIAPQKVQAAPAVELPDGLDATADTVTLTDEELAQYLAPASKIESDAPQIRAIARKVAPYGQPKNAHETKAVARAAYDFVRGHLTYNARAASANKGALAGLQAGTGLCEEYASLFVAILRAAGVPARIVNGFASDSKALVEYNGPTGLQGRRHQWAEFYVDGEGWIPVDPTLANSKNALFGELPAGFYLIQNYGDTPVKARHAGGQIGGSFEYRVTAGN